MLLSNKPVCAHSAVLICYYSQALEEEMTSEDFGEATEESAVVKAKSTVRQTHSKGKAVEKVKV